jgi:hypothetical protein
MFAYYSSVRNIEKMLEMADQLCMIFKRQFGEQSEFYADGLYLQAKALFGSA